MPLAYYNIICLTMAYYLAYSLVYHAPIHFEICTTLANQLRCTWSVTLHYYQRANRSYVLELVHLRKIKSCAIKNKRHN